ncbi:MAG: hypothetical protein IJK31_08760 [Ruminococcus sp.]|nr:hypothetical protein [Ruminococcus sp.]
MRRQHNSLWTSFPLSIAVSALSGIAVIAAASLLLAGITLFLLHEMIFVKYIAFLDICLGGISAGWICGKFRRRHGMKEGAVCGIVVYSFLAALSILITGCFTSPGKLLLLALMGAAGGVCGVNTKRFSKV